MTRTTTPLPHKDLTATIPVWNGTSGNYDTSRTPITKIIIHTMVGTMQSTTYTFQNRANTVSSHYAVGLDGSLVQFVREDHTAYHCGNLVLNRQTIGIEHEDNKLPNNPRTDALYETSAKLVADLCKFYNIPIDALHIIPHSSVKATGCPGTLDVNRIIKRANDIANPIVVAPPVGGVSVGLSDDEVRALQVLKAGFASLRTPSGQPFGNYEGLLRELVEVYPKYISYQGKVVVDNTAFLTLGSKASALSQIGQLLGLSAVVDTNPTQIVTAVSILKQQVSGTTPSNGLSGVLGTENAQISPDQQAKPLLFRDVQDIFSSITTKLFGGSTK
jgi:hypothetical protein